MVVRGLPARRESFQKPRSFEPVSIWKAEVFFASGTVVASVPLCPWGAMIRRILPEAEALG
jgi:hypothetical protein